MIFYNFPSLTLTQTSTSLNENAENVSISENSDCLAFSYKNLVHSEIFGYSPCCCVTWKCFFVWFISNVTVIKLIFLVFLWKTLKKWKTRDSFQFSSWRSHWVLSVSVISSRGWKNSKRENREKSFYWKIHEKLNHRTQKVAKNFPSSHRIFIPFLQAFRRSEWI